MSTLNYSIEINAPPDKVWETMLDNESYKKWAKAFSPKSQFKGEWEQGSHMFFFDPDLGGTKAELLTVEKPNKILASHVAITNKEGVEDVESEIAKKWIGAEEEYTFIDKDDRTELKIEMRCHDEFKNMMDDGWDKALKLLKDLCES